MAITNWGMVKLAKKASVSMPAPNLESRYHWKKKAATMFVPEKRLR